MFQHDLMIPRVLRLFGQASMIRCDPRPPIVQNSFDTQCEKAMRHHPLPGSSCSEPCKYVRLFFGQKLIPTNQIINVPDLSH